MQNYITLELGTKGKEIFFGWTKDFCCLNIGNIEVSLSLDQVTILNREERLRPTQSSRASSALVKLVIESK